MQLIPQGKLKCVVPHCKNATKDWLHSFVVKISDTYFYSFWNLVVQEKLGTHAIKEKGNSVIQTHPSKPYCDARIMRQSMSRSFFCTIKVLIFIHNSICRLKFNSWHSKNQNYFCLRRKINSTDIDSLYTFISKILFYHIWTWVRKCLYAKLRVFYWYT